MRQLYIVGIGAGDPEQVTMQAISALNQVDVFFVADKGPAKDDLVALRSEICRRYITDKPYRIVEVPDPQRRAVGPHTGAGGGYSAAVDDWHERRAACYEDVMLAELREGDTPGFLVWGDPALYDSTIRVVERLQDRGALEFEFTVVPAISSVQALAAAHKIVLNRVGEPIHITTGRRLQHGLPADQDNVVVMLDGELICRTFTEPGLEIYWGAYLGTSDEILVAGPLAEVIGRIAELRAAARARKGWIMDTYLLRRSPAAAPEI